MKEKSRFPAFDSLTKKWQTAVIMLAEPSATQHDVAQVISVSEATLSRRIKDPNFQAAQAEWDGELFRRLRSKAIHTMSTLLAAKSEMVRYNAAAYVLDKTNVADDMQAALIDRAQAEAKIAVAKAKVYEDETDGSGSYGLIVDIPREGAGTDGMAKDK